jgi:hypothetical protein
VTVERDGRTTHESTFEWARNEETVSACRFTNEDFALSPEQVRWIEKHQAKVDRARGA